MIRTLKTIPQWAAVLLIMALCGYANAQLWPDVRPGHPNAPWNAPGLQSIPAGSPLPSGKLRRWSDNGHFYEFVRFTSSRSNTWYDARAAASRRTFAGKQGYLATITSSRENAFIITNFSTGVASEGAWIGGIAANDDGVWRWATGPEAGTQFALGKKATAPFYYANWGGVEPNHAQANENYLVINVGLKFADVIQTGQWWDAVVKPWQGDPVVGYIVEYDAPPDCVPDFAHHVPPGPLPRASPPQKAAPSSKATQSDTTSGLRPSINIAHSGPNLVLSWPTWAADYQLQQIDGSLLARSSWTNVQAKGVTNDADIVVSLPFNPGIRFFRLYRP
jgi:hypothetical protein